MTQFSILFCLAGLAAAQATNRCPSISRPVDFAAPAWNGWGPDGSNARFQPDKAAQLPVARVPRLKLKWAFGFAEVKSVMGAPVVVGGRVFLGVDNGSVYSLDAATGCEHWVFRADAGVRSAVTVERVGTRSAAFFGDLKANAYAV